MHVFLGNFGLRKVMNTSQIYETATMQAETPGFQLREQLCGEDMGITCGVYAMGGILTELFGI